MTSYPIILPVSDSTVQATGPVTGLPAKKQPESGRRKLKRERRRNRQDRRKDVRDGVVVYLSVKNDRRKNRDRRQV